MSRVLIVIPTYNERENIASLLDRIESSLIDREFFYTILFVDDNSPDGTAEEIETVRVSKKNILLIRRATKMGIGSAYLDGFRWALSNTDAEFFIQMDADLQHPPSLLPDLVRRCEEGYDMALGSRYLEGGGAEDWPWYRRLVSKTANTLVRIILRLKVKDATSGFRILNRRAVEILIQYRLDSRSYPYQIESLFLLSKLGMKICEVPYIFLKRRFGRSKLSFKEILRFNLTIIRLRVFGIRGGIEQSS